MDVFNDDPTAAEMRKFLVSTAEGLEIDQDELNFDVEAAIYWFAYHWHGGQNSNLYSALSTSEYNPGQGFAMSDPENEVIRMLLARLEDEYTPDPNPVEPEVAFGLDITMTGRELRKLQAERDNS
jgi:hypothetical protein